METKYTGITNNELTTADDWENVFAMRDIEMAETGNCKKAALMARELIRPLLFGDKINWKSNRTDSETWEDIYSEAYFICLEGLRTYERGQGNFITHIWGKLQALAREYRNAGIPEYQKRKKDVSVSSYDEMEYRSEHRDGSTPFQMEDSSTTVEKMMDAKQNRETLELMKCLLGKETYENLENLSAEEATDVSRELEFLRNLFGGLENWTDEMIEEFAEEIAQA